MTQLLDSAARLLAGAGIDKSRTGARSEARRLLMAATGMSAHELIAADLAVSAPARARFEQMLSRRINKEPISRIIGKKAFWSMEMIISEATLDPRPETEILVETALEILPKNAAKTIYDLGCGSACILLAILAERPNCFGIGIDISPPALEIARQNARLHRLSDSCALVALNWLDGIKAPADMIVSNPPYIRSADIAGLDEEVRRFDPLLALDGGPDGLAPLRQIAAGASKKLVSGGHLLIELGAGSADMARDILAAAGYISISVKPDLAGITRIIHCQQP